MVNCKKVDVGLLLFGFLMGTMAIIAGIFASNVIPSIFQTREGVNQIQYSFNQSQIETLENLGNLTNEILRISKDIQVSHNSYEEVTQVARNASQLNVQMTKINSDNIKNIMNNISEINTKLLK